MCKLSLNQFGLSWIGVCKQGYGVYRFYDYVHVMSCIDKHAPMPPVDDVDPSLLESLEDSTSSSDVPKSKLDKVRVLFLAYQIRLPTVT